jgi:hypothetical protein
VSVSEPFMASHIECVWEHLSGANAPWMAAREGSNINRR